MGALLNLSLDLPPRGSRRLRRALHDQLKVAMETGRLAAGTRLPSTREMAAAFGVSRNTMVVVFNRLVNNGYLRVRRGAGAFISELVAARRCGPALQQSADARISAFWRAPPSIPPQFLLTPVEFDFRLGITDINTFPFDVWRRILARSVRWHSRSEPSYSKAQGREALRQAIATHLSVTRAVRFLVAPPWALQALIAAKRFADWQCSTAEQETLTAFITEGHLGRHIRKAQRLYAARRAALLGGIKQHFSRSLEVIPSMAGLHVTACRLRKSKPQEMTRTDCMASARVARRALLLALVLLALSARAADSPPPAPDGSLETIVVQGQKLAVETKIDRKIYSLPQDAQTTLGTLSDILSVIPSVDVDPDGILSLRGDTNVLILIDGKPATQLQGSKAGDNLQSISASDIERIEVLTTPPAQFKAEGAAGVINIITRKRGSKESASASLTGSLGSGGRWLVAESANYGSKHFTASLNAGFREDYRGRTVQSMVIGADPATGQVLQSRDHAEQRLRRNIPSVGLSTEYDPNERQSLAVSGSWLSRGGLRTYSQYDVTALQSGAVTSETRRLTSGHDPENDYDAKLEFSQKLSHPGESLDLSAHRSISHQHEHYDYINDSFVPLAPTFYNNLSFTEDHGITEAGVDYTLPLSKLQTLKLGYAFEADYYGFDNVGANVDPLTGAETIDPTLTNQFKFNQRIHALYLSEQGSVGAWSWLAGVRTEWTTSDAVQLTNSLSTTMRYTDLFPSLHVDRSLSDRSTLTFGASRRIVRPNPSYLNPYVDHEYPPNLNAGNPNLRPQFAQSFELGYGYEGQGPSYGMTGYYRRNTDSVTDLTEYLGNGLTLTTKTNLPKSDSAGFEFSATGRVFPKLSYSLSGNAFYTQINATALGTPGLKSTAGLNVKAKLDFHPTATDSAQFTFTRTDKRLTPQGNLSAINIVNLGYKRALTQALSFSATISDLFNGQHYQRSVSTPTLTQVYERSIAGRVAWLGLTYTIGVAKKEKESGFEYDDSGG